MASNNGRFSAADVAHILKLHRDGIPNRAIAERMGLGSGVAGAARIRRVIARETKRCARG